MSDQYAKQIRLGRNGSIVSDTPVPEISGSGDVSYYGGHLLAESVSPGNARRMVACWNACAGSTTEWLEFQLDADNVDQFGPPEPFETRYRDAMLRGIKAVEQREELLATLKQIANWQSHTTEYAIDNGSNGVREVLA